jgi:hypothetical protein
MVRPMPPRRLCTDGLCPVEHVAGIFWCFVTGPVRSEFILHLVLALLRLHVVCPLFLRCCCNLVQPAEVLLPALMQIC